MELSHVISEVVLAAVCIYVFFKYLLGLEFSATILWEAFVLSIGAAAICGALKYAGFSWATDLNLLFQTIAGTVGAISLVAAAWFLINERDIPYTYAILVLVLGLILLIFTENFDTSHFAQKVPLVTMGLTFLIGVLGLIKGKTMSGLWLILGVLCVVFAVFRDKFIDDPKLAVDAFHYFLAAGVLCFGIAASQHKYKSTGRI